MHQICTDMLICILVHVNATICTFECALETRLYLLVEKLEENIRDQQGRVVLKIIRPMFSIFLIKFNSKIWSSRNFGSTSTLSGSK